MIKKFKISRVVKNSKTEKNVAGKTYAMLLLTKYLTKYFYTFTEAVPGNANLVMSSWRLQF